MKESVPGLEDAASASTDRRQSMPRRQRDGPWTSACGGVENAPTSSTDIPGKIDHLVLLTGLSGAGKSCALNYLEDIGFCWTDNLPLPLISTYLSHFLHKKREGDVLEAPLKRAEGGEVPTRVAMGLHFRDRACLESFQSVYQKLSGVAERTELLFMEANFDTLISRYRETRRRHPMAKGHTVQEAIFLEMQALEPIRAMADLIIGTSQTTIPQLKDRLDQLFQENTYDGPDASTMTIFIRSFGFKFGVSTDADMVLDGRFLPNPYYDPELRPFNGCDEPIIRFLEKDGEALDFLHRLQSMFDYLIPRYQREKKLYFTIDIGCTGGQHRSVFLVEQLTKRLRHQGFRVLMRHRDLDRGIPQLETE